jgi:thiamine transport system ATP-binding protein
MLDAKGLCFRFSDFDAQYDLSIATGAFVGLIGPSGGGKTTLLDGLAGFSQPASGTLTFDGINLLPLPPTKRPISVIFQDYNLFPHLSAWDNAALAIRPSGRLSEAEHEHLRLAFDKVELTGKELRKPDALSGGERQRVAIARALVSNKRLLLLDEPFGALDPGLRLAMIRLIDQLRRERQITVLLSIHTPFDLAGVADQIAFVADGRVAAFEPAARLLEARDNPAIQRYLGTIKGGVHA